MLKGFYPALRARPYLWLVSLLVLGSIMWYYNGRPKRLNIPLMVVEKETGLKFSSKMKLIDGWIYEGRPNNYLVANIEVSKDEYYAFWQQDKLRRYKGKDRTDSRWIVDNIGTVAPHWKVQANREYIAAKFDTVGVMGEESGGGRFNIYIYKWRMLEELL